MPTNPDRVLADVDELAPMLRDVATKIHQNPELCYKEVKAAGWLTEAVELAGFDVERELCGITTAFRATAGTGASPRVAILAEYDALPEIGHACGHNLIAGGALGAFLALARQGKELPGTVDLIGTPAEEGGGGKIQLLLGDAFDGIDAAMMYHPFDRDLLAHSALAMLYANIEFEGKPSHAAIAPWDGTSALSAVLETFRMIDAHRVHFKDGVRVHGIVTNGGQAVNIIPEKAAARFSVRARDTDELMRVAKIVERCARGAATAFDVRLKYTVEKGYRDMKNNQALAARFGANLERLGRTALPKDDEVGAGSTDMGDVSHKVPSIHPYLAICEKGETTCHQHAFQACANSERGFATMIMAAKTMALTALDFLGDAELQRRVRAEFEAR